MKKFLILVVFFLAVGNSYSQDASDGTTAVLISPSLTAIKLVESAAETIFSPFASTMASVQARGVAGMEQIKDDLVALEEDMKSGDVRSLAEVRQPALKELFHEIAANDEQMEEINSVIESGSKLHRIATAVTVQLLLQ